MAVAALAKGLARSHEVTIFQAGSKITSDVNTIKLPVEEKWPKSIKEGVFRFVYLDYYSRKIAKFTLKFLPYFFRYKYDVVIPANGGWQVIICRIISWGLRKKMVIQGNAGIGYDDLLQLHCCPDYYVAISPQGFVWAKRFVPWVKKIYIPYGVDFEIFRQEKPVTVDLHKPIVLSVAAFSPYKRLDLVIRAVEYVPEASLLIIGQGLVEKELRELGNKLLGTRFKLLTGVNHAELVGYYKASDVFTLPSKASEALGIVYIEAMAAGLPVVAPDDYNRREIIGNAGIFVDPENQVEYAAAIKKALQVDYRKKALYQAKKFSWDKIVNQYEKLLVNLI